MEEEVSLREHQGAVLEAHWRNLESRRGGRQGRARTRGIHRHLLSLLKQRIERLLSVLAPRSQRAEAWNLRVQQIDERTRFLNNNWPEDKHIVLPGLREWAAENLSDSSAVTVAIESESEVETLCHSSDEEDQSVDVPATSSTDVPAHPASSSVRPVAPKVNPSVRPSGTPRARPLIPSAKPEPKAKAITDSSRRVPIQLVIDEPGTSASATPSIPIRISEPIDQRAIPRGCELHR